MSETNGDVQIVTLLASDLVASTQLVTRLGDSRAADLLGRHDRLARDLMRDHRAREIDKTDGFLLVFSRPAEALAFAIAYHDLLAVLSQECGERIDARVGIHLGEVVMRDNISEDVARGAKPVELEGLAKPIVARVMSLAIARQTLLTRAAFDLARRGSLGSTLTSQSLTWLAHGSYLANGIEDPIEIFEVGRTGFAPLTAPADSSKMRVIPDPDTITGWRPAPGTELPGRPGWILEERVGVGGFGDVWRAVHRKSGAQNVFKFCYDREHLRALKHEVWLVRLLKQELGDRSDIARILDWNFDHAPYFIESEWTAGGSFNDWLERKGGATGVPLEVRLELVAQIADALAAAHSVGVLHKDIKPSNILISEDHDGVPRAKLTDFGIGLVTDRERSARSGITELFTNQNATNDMEALSGTRLYMAPEILEQQQATVHADVYALGVVLYQAVLGDFTRALSSGWEQDVSDPLLRDDIAAAVDRRPEQRVDPRALAQRLRELDVRRTERERQSRLAAHAARNRARWRWASLAAGAMLLIAVATGIQLRRVNAEARRANREAETSRRTTAFMTDLFRLADPGEARGNTVTAREILDQGAARIDSQLRDQPEVQAALMSTMGRVYLGLGLVRSANPILERALVVRQRVYGSESLEAADGLALLADAEFDAADYASSDRHYETALATRTKLLGAQDASVAVAHLGMARARWRLGNLRSAGEHGAIAIRLLRPLKDHRIELARALEALATVSFAAGAFQGADTLYRQALSLSQQLFGEKDRRVARITSNLGLTLGYEGKFDEAESNLRQSLSINRQLMGESHPTVATNEQALGVLLHQRGKLAEADSFQRRALVIIRERLGPSHPQTAGVMMTLSWVLADEGKCNEAGPMAEGALDVFNRTMPGLHWAIAQSRSIVGECLAARGRYAQAESLLVSSYPTIQAEQPGPSAVAALRRIVSFYEQRGNKAKADEYRKLPVH